MIYDRYARDLSPSLFDSVYVDLFRMAETEQRAIYAACKARPRRGRAPADYRVGERQQMLDGFCRGTVSLGEAMDAIGSAKA